MVAIVLLGSSDGGIYTLDGSSHTMLESLSPVPPYTQNDCSERVGRVVKFGKGIRFLETAGAFEAFVPYTWNHSHHHFSIRLHY